MITLIERARRYVSAMPAPLSKSRGGMGKHAAMFAAACALIKGFGLSIDEARALLEEYSVRGEKRWSAAEIQHKLRSVDGSADSQDRGYLIGNRNDARGSITDAAGAGNGRQERQPRPKPEYDPEMLRNFSGDWARTVDLVWLANRSTYDPAFVGAADFLSLMYGREEKVLVFTQYYSQGQAVWPADAVPTTGREGVWYLIQPVDGEEYPNPRSRKLAMSRRSEESVSAWRYMILESDEAPVREWLGAVVQLPLRIAAIYTSGGRSVHVLIRVDAQTKKHWDALRAAMAPGLRWLVMNGADKGVLSAVRLSRLPGCWREGKAGKDGYVRFERPILQKLLYVCPEPEVRPLIEQFARRNVESEWVARAEAGRSDSDDGAVDWVAEGLRYYAPVSERIRRALATYERE